MVAINTKRVRCIVVRVPADADLFAERGALAHEMMPGADPYIAHLIRRLQDEVRFERRMEQLQNAEDKLIKQARFADADLAGDLEWPVFDIPLDDEPLGEESLPDFSNEN